MAASGAIDQRVGQESALLAIEQTYRTLVIDCRFVMLPRPATPTAVAIIDEPTLDIAPATATLALSVGVARLAIDQAALSVGGEREVIRDDALPYRWLGPFAWELVSPIRQYSAVWVDGLMGWGTRTQQHGMGYDSALSASASTMRSTASAKPLVGTAFQWDRELLAIAAVVGEAGDWTLTLARGLDGTIPATHVSSTTLYELGVPDDLNYACVIVAKRYADARAQPGAGPSYDPTGNPSPSVWRNVDELLRKYRRPLAA